MKRVVITGLGAVTPIGNSVHEFWKNSLAGKSGGGKITRFNAEKFRTRIAAEVENFKPEQYLSRNEIKRSDLFTQYGLFCAAEAMEDAGLDMEKIDSFDVGVIWGCAQGGMTTIEKELETYYEGGQNPRFNPFFIPKFLVNMVSGVISMKFGLRGINYTATSACASANTAISDAFNYIRLGKAKAMITGGSEAAITPASIGGYSALKAMSGNHENPEKASRPFDVGRDGFVMGEGGGALVLEEYEHAKKRGATIYAEVIGTGMTADAYHITSPRPDGFGAAKAMELALKEAQITPDEVNYLNVHATSTAVGDLSELKAVQKTFPNPESMAISATKSMTGHLLGAAGAVEAILSVLAVKNNQIPPTINVEEMDPAIPENLNIVTQSAIDQRVEVAMSNNFGFGGHNATVIFKKI